MSTGDGFGHRWGRNDELCVAVSLLPGLLEYSGLLYASLIRCNPRRHKGQRDELGLTEYVVNIHSFLNRFILCVSNI